MNGFHPLKHIKFKHFPVKSYRQKYTQYQTTLQKFQAYFFKIGTVGNVKFIPDNDGTLPFDFPDDVQG